MLSNQHGYTFTVLELFSSNILTVQRILFQKKLVNNKTLSVCVFCLPLYYSIANFDCSHHANEDHGNQHRLAPRRPPPPPAGRLPRRPLLLVGPLPLADLEVLAVAEVGHLTDAGGEGEVGAVPSHARVLARVQEVLLQQPHALAPVHRRGRHV